MNSFNYYSIELVEQFHCLAADCPATCCGNWHIEIDSETYECVKAQKGLRGFQMKCAIRHDKDLDKYFIRKNIGHCVYYRRKLCSLQCKGYENCMPKVCRLYPRRTVSYGYRVETSLELSCIYVAAMFVEKACRLQYKPSDKQHEIFWTLDNDDKHFLDFLVEDREVIMDYWWQENRSDITTLLRNIYSYVYAEYMWIVRNQLEKAFSLPLPLNTEELSNQLIAPRIGLNQSLMGLYPLRFMNELIYEQLSYPGLRFQNPGLYKLVHKYFKQFGQVYEKDSEEFLRTSYDLMLEKQPELEELFMAYYSYLFSQTYCEAYTDYYILGPVLLSSVHMEFLMLFCIVEFLDCGEVSSFRRAEIITYIEKGIRHKDALNGVILSKIRDTYFAQK